MNAPTEADHDPRQIFQPGRLWSLWEMLKYAASDFLELGQALALIQMAMTPDGMEPQPRTPEEEQNLRNDLAELSKGCQRLEMQVSTGMVNSCVDRLPVMMAEYTMLSDALAIELQAKKLLYIPNERARFFENDRILSDPAKQAFPTAYAEIREAGSCYAVGRYTACVLHCMRAAEVGVKAMARALGYNPQDLAQQDWHPVLNKCESLIQDMRDKMQKGPNKEVELQFYSQAAAQFRHFKDGWRVQAAHTRPPFNEGEAKIILESTVSFYEVLTVGLSEDAQTLAPVRGGQ